MLRLARRTAPFVAAFLMALAAWFWWPALWPPATRWLAPLIVLVAVLMLRRVTWEPRPRNRSRGRTLSLDEAVRRAADEWDARHAPDADADPVPDADDAWRASVSRPPWERTPDEDADDGEPWEDATR